MQNVTPTPSLEATADLSEAVARKVTSTLFGCTQFLDYKKFEHLCFQDRLLAAKAELLGENEALTAEIEALHTQEELQAFVLREDVQLTRNALILAQQGGQPYRIDTVAALSGNLGLSWSAAGIGFGQCHFYVGEDGRLHVDSKCMGRHFLRSLLLRLADELVIED